MVEAMVRSVSRDLGVSVKTDGVCNWLCGPAQKLVATMLPTGRSGDKRASQLLDHLAAACLACARQSSERRRRRHAPLVAQRDLAGAGLGLAPGKPGRGLEALRQVVRLQDVHDLLGKFRRGLLDSAYLDAAESSPGGRLSVLDFRRPLAPARTPHGRPPGILVALSQDSRGRLPGEFHGRRQSSARPARPGAPTQKRLPHYDLKPSGRGGSAHMCDVPRRGHVPEGKLARPCVPGRRTD
jgi:hypothetical protein